MKYCDECGYKLPADNLKFCPECGKNLITKESNNNKTSEQGQNSMTIIVCAIVGLLFPIIGAILYYVLKKNDIKAAKTANICAWIGFLFQILLLVFAWNPFLYY